MNLSDFEDNLGSDFENNKKIKRSEEGEQSEHKQYSLTNSTVFYNNFREL